jgi:hypothetical protein
LRKKKEKEKKIIVFELVWERAQLEIAVAAGRRGEDDVTARGRCDPVDLPVHLHHNFHLDFPLAGRKRNR